MKISAENKPTNGARSTSGTPTIRSSGARNANTWLTPSPSIIDVSQNTTTTRIQSLRPRSSSVVVTVAKRIRPRPRDPAVSDERRLGRGGRNRMIGRYVNRAVDAQQSWSRPFGDFNHRWLGALFHAIRPIQ